MEVCKHQREAAPRNLCAPCHARDAQLCGCAAGGPGPATINT